MDAQTKIAAAKSKCIKDYPWMFEAFFKLDPRPKDGCGTIATDSHLRLYYDPEVVMQSDMNMLTYRIKAATLPPILLHGSRGKTVTNTKSGMDAWCTASDVVVNDLLQHDNQWIPYDAKTFSNTEDIDGMTLPRDLSMEQYFRLLYQQDEPEQDPNGDGNTDGDGDGDGDSAGNPGVDDSGDGTGESDGSGKHGQPQSWEDPYETPKLGEDSDGVTEQELDDLRESMVERRGSDSMSQSGCQALSSMAAETNEHKISAQELLRMAICTDLSKMKRGHDVPSYKRPARRPSWSSFVRPSYQSPEPSVCVVVDVSSSMSTDEIKLAFGMIDTVFKGMRVKELRVVGANVDINTDQIVRRLEEVDLKLGGGTCMKTAVNRIMSAPPSKLPDLTILVTDGGTYWPDKTPTPFLACITGPEGTYHPAKPDWMKLVYMVD